MMSRRQASFFATQARPPSCQALSGPPVSRLAISAR